jgi:two-component system, NarL family, nitrate/nitrite response regulator NarL
MTTKTKPIRIVLADDHPILRDGLRMLLRSEPGFDVVGEAGDGAEALALVERLSPDVLLLDLAMPGMSGLKVLEEIGRRRLTVKAIILAAAITQETTIAALELGARGVLLKEAATPMLYRCVRQVMAGEFWVGRDAVGDLVAALRASPTGESSRRGRLPHLTERELSVIAAVTDGECNRGVAQRLGISEQTVKNHLRNIFDKVGVSSRLELAVFAQEREIVTDAPRKPGPSN